MTVAEPLYNVRERTGNSEHLLVDDVVNLVHERAEHPRADHQDAHLDEAMATVVDRYGLETVRTVIQRVLVDEEPFRTAMADLVVDNVDGFLPDEFGGTNFPLIHAVLQGPRIVPAPRLISEYARNGHLTDEAARALLSVISPHRSWDTSPYVAQVRERLGE